MTIVNHNLKSIPEFSFINEEQVFIYGLVDSSGHCFYVGQTVSPRLRLNCHRGSGSFAERGPFRMAILEIAENPDIAWQREAWWIKEMRRNGFVLTNQREPIKPTPKKKGKKKNNAELIARLTAIGALG